MAARQLLSKHYTRILSRWPSDLLRPETPFQSLLQSRIAKLPTQTEQEAGLEMRNVNALYCLLDDRFAKRFPMPKDLMKPLSNPVHYDDLAADISQAPRRTKSESTWIWLRGKVRLS